MARNLFRLKNQRVIHNPQSTVAIKNPLCSVRFCENNKYERIFFKDATIAMTEVAKKSLEVDGIISNGAFISSNKDGSLDVGLCFLNTIVQDRVSQKIRDTEEGEEVEITLITANYGAFYIKGTPIEHFAGDEYILTSDSTKMKIAAVMEAVY